MYDGKPMQLKFCYQQLKNCIKRPANSVGHTQEKPNYMKMTFAMSRSVAPNSKILQLSSMVGSLKHLAKKESSTKELNAQSSSDITLLKQLKNQGSEFSMKPTQLLNEGVKKKSNDKVFEPILKGRKPSTSVVRQRRQSTN